MSDDDEAKGRMSKLMQGLMQIGCRVESESQDGEGTRVGLYLKAPGTMIASLQAPISHPKPTLCGIAGCTFGILGPKTWSSLQSPPSMAPLAVIETRERVSRKVPRD
jgi:hypothetical protein